jgi:hypothetical protein
LGFAFFFNKGIKEMTMIQSLAFALALFTVSAANASTSICPDGTRQVSSCVSDDFLPFYPFASVCQDQSGYSLAIDPGADKEPESASATRVDTASAVVFTSADMGFALSMDKTNSAGKVKATLNYTSFSESVSSSYTCTALSN